MQIQLDTPNPAIPQDKTDPKSELGQIDVNNIAKIQKVINGTGVFVHKDIILTTATNFNSATFALVFNFECAFVSSGGFVEADFQGTIANATPNQFQIQIVVDNDPNKTRTFQDDSAVAETSLTSFWWKGFLGEGKHNIQIQAKTGGNVVFSPSSLTCEFQVREIKL